MEKIGNSFDLNFHKCKKLKLVICLSENVLILVKIHMFAVKIVMSASNKNSTEIWKFSQKEKKVNE